MEVNFNLLPPSDGSPSELLDSVLLPGDTGSCETSWSGESERIKLHEAIWKQSCSRTHALWCACGNWTSHIKLCGGGSDAGGGETGGGATGAGDIENVDPATAAEPR
ncbi:hypothetical protein QKL46_gp2 [Paguma larvata torque teno virus]|nr:hypothetical protein QKL46_gp2 [Paguma larvata torque teno virus]BBE36919.1 hypothetical protein [Paguma larvata torque teno virus]